MTPKLKAKKLISQFSLGILAELGYKISLEEVAALAKSSALSAIDEMINILNPEDWGLEMDAAIDKLNYLKEVKKEIEKL